MSQPPRLEIGKILVPMDFEDGALHALAWARGLAERFGSVLHVLHVVPNPYVANAYMPMPLPPGFLEQLVADAGKRLDEVLTAEDREAFGATPVVRVGDARTEILDHAGAEGVDLIVMGTHARRGAAHFFLGSVAEKVLRGAACPVVTVR